MGNRDTLSSGLHGSCFWLPALWLGPLGRQNCHIGLKRCFTLSCYHLLVKSTTDSHKSTASGARCPQER